MGVLDKWVLNKAKKVLDNASKRLEYILTEKNIIKTKMLIQESNLKK